jgi:N-methylhydantoinase B
MRQLDVHLAVDDDRGAVVCRDCDEAICDAGENYKLHALCDRKPLIEAGPLVNDPEEYVDEEVEFRQFYCPGCGRLLENEVILAELEPVHDKELR